MKRNLLAAAAAFAPLLAGSGPVLAQTTISGSTSTPVKTSTANNGQPSDVVVSGSIGLTAPGVALTLDSNNNVNVTGQLGATNQDNTTGLQIIGGNTGSATNQGTITVTESATPPVDPNGNGLNTGAFATGTNRAGIEVTLPTTGATAFVGNNATVTTTNGNIVVDGITNVGQITIVGNNSYGVLIAAPVTGNFMSTAVIPATSSTNPIVLNGNIGVTGQDSVGFNISPTGSVSGNVRLTTVSAIGPGAQGVVLNGGVGGFVNVSGSVNATGYRTTTRQTNPFISILYSQMEMQQGGAAMTVGGNIGGGLIISAPPTILSTTAYADSDGDGVPDSLQSTGSVTSFGAAPAIQIGSAGANATTSGQNITLGLYTASTYVSKYNGTGLMSGGFGFVNQGSILGEGLFDQLTSPYLLNPVSATALQIGGQILVTPDLYSYNSSYQPTSNTPTTPAVYGQSGQVTIAGGVYNSGSIGAYAYQANATAIHVGAGASTPQIYNDGVVFALSTQVNSATGPTTNGKYPTTPTPVPVSVTAIQIGDPGAALGSASVASITNNSGITAELTGSGGVGGVARAIVDYTGTLTTVNNAGSIQAVLNQTDITQPMPVVTTPLSASTVAIDMHYGTTAQTINQSAFQLPTGITATAYDVTQSYTTLNTVVSYGGNYYVNVAAAGAGVDPINYPQDWREIGAVTPSITGDIYMGQASDTLNIQAGTVVANNILMGAATNTINVGNASTSAVVSGAIAEAAGGQFVFNVQNGTLADLNPALGQNAQTINVGAKGVLTVTVDPLNNQNTQFHVTGSATITPGGQIGLTLATLQIAPSQTYTVIYGLPGTITATSLGATAIGNAPFLYSATASYVASSSASAAPGAPPAGDSAIDLTVSRKTASQLGFNAAEAAAYDPVLATLQQQTAANQGIQQALLSQTTAAGLKSVYDQLLPNQGQGIFQALDAAVEKVSGMVGVRPDNGTKLAGSSLWLQEVNERVDRAGENSLASNAQILGLVGGYERMGSGGGALGVTLAYYNASENNSAAQINSRDLGSLVEGSIYYRRQAGPLAVSARVGGGYGWFSETRMFAYGQTIELAHASWSGAFLEGHLGASYEVKLFGPYYARPEVSVDYLRLSQGHYQETGSDSAFNLAVTPGDDTQASAEGLMVFGRQWGRAAWFRTEVRLGYREVFDGTVGTTTASFLNGTPFTLVGDPEKGGWATVGFSFKTGSEFSYLALEGDADVRKGQQRYDLRVAGRSVF